MGLLITQRKTEKYTGEGDGKVWRIGIREKWRIDNQKETSRMMGILMGIKIPFEIAYEEEATFINFNDVKIEFDNIDDLQTAMNELIDFKNKYGTIKEKVMPELKDERCKMKYFMNEDIKNNTFPK